MNLHKITTIVLFHALLFMNTMQVKAQFISGFESWYTTTNGLEIPAPSLGYRWTSLDSFYRPLQANSSIDFITKKATIANGGVNSGSYALSLGVLNIYNNGTQFYSSAGQIWLGDVNYDGAQNFPYVAQYMPFTLKPVSISGYYKMTSGSNYVDTATMICKVFDADKIQIGIGVQKFGQLSNNYMPFVVPVNYIDTISLPSFMTYTIIMGGNDPVYINLPDTAIYNHDTLSRIYFDDLSFNYPNGIHENLMDNSTIRIYPNPVVNEINIDFINSESIINKVKIFNVKGIQLFETELTSLNNKLSLIEFPKGNYILQFYNKENLKVYGYKINKL